MEVLWQVRPAFSTIRSFFIFLMVMMAFSVRTEHGGVASIVRALHLRASAYQSFCDHFSSNSINLELLTTIWSKLLMRIFDPFLEKFNGKNVFIIDGIKAPKEGRRMPGIKKMHQSSQSNSKAEYIWGHSCQAICLLVTNQISSMAVPLITRIDDGLGNMSKTIFDKAIDFISSTMVMEDSLLVGDAYYFSGKFAEKLKDKKIHLISRVRKNAVAYTRPSAITIRGRPKIYGKKVKLKDYFCGTGFELKKTEIYGNEEKVLLKEKILISKNHKFPLKYIFVERENGDQVIFVSTNLDLLKEDILRIYSKRFKIEVSFKEFVHRIGGFTYRFWSKSVAKTRKSNEEKRCPVKERCYHVYLQYAVMAQGVINYLSLTMSKKIWNNFGGWLRTIRPNVLPSEQVVMMALSNCLLDFLQGNEIDKTFRKFYKNNLNRRKNYELMGTG